MDDNDPTTIFVMGDNDEITMQSIRGDAFAFLERKMKRPCGKIVKSVDKKPGNRKKSTYESAQYLFFKTDINETTTGKTDAEIMKVLDRSEKCLQEELKTTMEEYGQQLTKNHVDQIRIVKTIETLGWFGGSDGQFLEKSLEEATELLVTHKLMVNTPDTQGKPLYKDIDLKDDIAETMNLMLYMKDNHEDLHFHVFYSLNAHARATRLKKSRAENITTKLNSNGCSAEYENTICGLYTEMGKSTTNDA